MKRVSDDLIAEAEKTSIVSLCQEYGYAIEKKTNQYYFGIEHDSLVIDSYKNKFYWNSQNISGNSILFAQTFFNKTFPEAVAMLTSKEYEKMNDTYVEPEKNFVYEIEHDTSTAAAEDYLVNERGIDKDIVSALIKKGLIRQDHKKNIVFVWGETGRRVGADLQGTVSKNNLGKRGTFKQIFRDSKSNYGFNVSLGVPKKLLFFEAPIDLLSYWSLNKHLKNCRLISMSGLKPRTVMNMMKHTYVSRGQYPTEGIFLGVDNDVAGHKFVDRFEQMLLETKDGQEIPFHNLIPNDLEIPKEYIPLYQDAAINHNVDWKDIAAIHKAETNLSKTNEIANYFGLGKFFGKVLENKEKPKEINLYDSINECAKSLAKNRFAGKFDLERTMSQPGHELGDLKKFINKVKRYSEKYSNLGYLPTKSMTKDWNDKLISEKNIKTKNTFKQKDVAVSR
ncbi:DUF3991 and TOPRIM domain-containing protein [Cytobacillus kochii]|uniref:DUF3991 and TOPRIM domain-containing protein n=1 Tax=Cytobacillus kochii TaxID=859143 RepID=UPI001CD5590F|nr:DUF3991 and TOPRIM domain-containing protein [Cytobacillus kochii]MCA1028845.1 DUF3991 and toprim domain-containing protein [Cytobacillus kochii]